MLINFTTWDLWAYMYSIKKERASYKEQNTVYFEKVVKINADSDSVILQEKESWLEEDRQ